MQISWNGLGSFTVVAKPYQTEVTCVTNPFGSATQKMKSMEASLVVSSHDGKDASVLTNILPEHPEEGRKVFHVVHAGEYEVQGIFVTGVNVPRADGSTHAVYKISAEGIHIGFLGALDRQLKTAEIEKLGPLDILFVPCGGNGVLSASVAAEQIAALEPRVVIPAYVSAQEGENEYTTIDAFVRALGLTPETMAKYKVTKAQLPEEDMKLIVLTAS